MLYLAKLLNNDNELKNPSIVVISDRTDLDDQISNLFLNSKNFIGDNNIVNVDSRKDLSEKLSNIKSGGVFMTTIQKFNKDLGVLSDRDNIICISDEAHRTQVQTTNKLVISNDEMKEGYSFAKAVRITSFSYLCRFHRTPIDETLNTFGEIVNSYTMEQSVKDGITTPIFYEGRNLKVVTNKNKLEEIEEYYRKCLEEGSNEYQINESKKAMARLNSILGNPERLELLSEDFINHYENRIDEGSYQLGKVMIVCSKREIAFDLYKLLISKRPSWVNKISDESNISDKNDSGIEKIKLVITRSKDDEKELYELAGNKKYRKSLDRSFKDKDSNFKIAIVVDMWTTGFDVPSLEAIYIDKPLKEHTLIQTISRVNRVHSGKESGLVIDYIGIKNSMNLALKEFNNNEKNNFQDVNDVQILLKEHLLLIDNLVDNKKFEDYSKMSPKDRFIYLNNLTEYIQSTEALEVKFMSLATKLHSLFRVCSSSEEITSEEHDRIQNYLAARTMIFKLTKGDAPDISIMNKEVEELVNESLISKSIDEVFKMSKDSEVINLFDSKNMELIQKIELPNTKLKALQKLINGGIKEVTKISKVKSIEFSKKFQKLVDKYNERNELETLRKNFLEDLAEEFTILAEDVSNEIEEFRTLGVSYEEKTYYDILHNSIQKNEFEYEESKLVDIAKTIKIIIDDISKNSDWSNREDLKAKINVQLTIILDEHNFPPVPEGEIYNEVVLQAMNYSSFDQ